MKRGKRQETRNKKQEARGKKLSSLVNHYLLLIAHCSLLIFLFSCQTVEKRIIDKSQQKFVKEDSLEDRLLKERIKEWEDHMNLVGYKELSIDTILKVTEGYFEAKEILYKKEFEEYEKALLGQEARSKKQEAKSKKKRLNSLNKIINL